jgi:hypothetical protein
VLVKGKLGFQNWVFLRACLPMIDQGLVQWG